MIGTAPEDRAAVRCSRELCEGLAWLAVVLFFLLFMALPACSAAESSRQGTVTRVWDGDTVSVSVEGRDIRVRLAGIDAPEHDQPFGSEARARMASLLDGASVRLEGEKTDRYGRLVAKVWVQAPDCRQCSQTLDAGLALLTEGLAWWYRQYRSEQSEEDQGRYEFAEKEARAKRAGLWSDPDPTPPWNWPRGDRAASTASDPDCRIKGNISDNGRIYHLPGQTYYDRTKISPSRGERWFCSEAEARAAGWRRARQ
jgi:endonuclease YncB( thermonuclease family)